MPRWSSHKKDFNWQEVYYTTKRLKNYSKIIRGQENCVKDRARIRDKIPSLLSVSCCKYVDCEIAKM